MLRQLSFANATKNVRNAVRTALPPQKAHKKTSSLPVSFSSIDKLVPAAVLCLLTASPAEAINVEPANALSLPTWAIHVSSVVEWVTAMFLFWEYAKVTGNERWKAMSWGMLPALGGAMSACTWHCLMISSLICVCPPWIDPSYRHAFYNSPDLEFLVVLQAGLTMLGNFTCWAAAYYIYQGFQQGQSKA